MTVDTGRAADLDDVMTRMSARDGDYRYSVAWMDLLASGSGGPLDPHAGDHTSRAELFAKAARQPLHYDPTPRLAAPPWVPLRAAQPNDRACVQRGLLPGGPAGDRPPRVDRDLLPPP